MAQPPPRPRIPAHMLPPSLAFSRWGWGLLAFILIAALHLLPAPALLALDSLPTEYDRPVATRVNRIDQPGESFPGAAYFLAEDAFTSINPLTDDASPGVTTLSPGQNSPHILQIEPGPAALSMPIRAISPADQSRALQCLTNAIYYEAGNEPEEGQRAVAQVILNRIASGRWPDSVCGTIYQGGERADRGCQFTFSCDGSMARTPLALSWSRARRVAERTLAGDIFAPAGLATFYHTLAVRPPWAERMRPVAVIGAHIFYRLPGDAGLPASYRMRYSGRESAQPGPYAFVMPPRLPINPPGPDAIEPWTAPQLTPTIVGQPSLQTAASASTTLAPKLSVHLSKTTDAPGQSRIDAASQSLPQSTIRPEYRNSGRPLR